MPSPSLPLQQVAAGEPGGAGGCGGCSDPSWTHQKASLSTHKEGKQSSDRGPAGCSGLQGPCQTRGPAPPPHAASRLESRPALRQGADSRGRDRGEALRRRRPLPLLTPGQRKQPPSATRLRGPFAYRAPTTEGTPPCLLGSGATAPDGRVMAPEPESEGKEVPPERRASRRSAPLAAGDGTGKGLKLPATQVKAGTRSSGVLAAGLADAARRPRRVWGLTRRARSTSGRTPGWSCPTA